MLRRVSTFVAMILVATFVLAACGSQNEEVEPTVTRTDALNAPIPPTATIEGASPPAAAPTQAAASGQGGVAAGPVTIDVEMLDIKFGQTEYTVPANTEITVNLTNGGAGTHNFNIDELGVKSGDYEAGKTGTITFNSGAPGEYEFYCNIPGHRENGMLGKLIVTDAAATAPVTASPAAVASAAPAADALAASIDVEMLDIKFDQTEYTVPANTEITVNLVNGGAGTHNFNIDALGVKSGDYESGKTGTVTFNSGAPGEYEFYCSIPGHKENGMLGKIKVVDPASAAPAAASTPAVAPTAPAAAALPATIDVEMLDIKFSETEYTVPANTEITVNLTNGGASAHNFDIDELGVKSGDYEAGKTGTLTFNSGAPGEYEFYCNIPGHKEAGMVGKIIVK